MNTDIINLAVPHTRVQNRIWYRYAYATASTMVVRYIRPQFLMCNSKISRLCHTDLLLFSNSSNEQKENTSYAMPMIAKIMEILAVYSRTINSD